MPIVTDLAIPVAPRETETESAAPPGRLEIPDFEIVPRAGLILVAIALVCLIVAVAADQLWPLMFLHVGGGAAWTIIDLFLVAGWQLGLKTGNVLSISQNHGWVVASYIIVGVMAVLALGLLEPANIAVLVELKKPRPNPHVIEQLMKRFIYCAGILGVMQIATLVIMTKLASG